MREPVEHINIDTQKLGLQLRNDVLSDQGDCVFTLADAMAQALGEAETSFLSNNYVALKQSLGEISELAVRSGFLTISQVAHDVACAALSNDRVAVGATLHRLLRIGENHSTRCGIYLNNLYDPLRSTRSCANVAVKRTQNDQIKC